MQMISISKNISTFNCTSVAKMEDIKNRSRACDKINCLTNYFVRKFTQK